MPHLIRSHDIPEQTLTMAADWAGVMGDVPPDALVQPVVQGFSHSTTRLSLQQQEGSPPEVAAFVELYDREMDQALNRSIATVDYEYCPSQAVLHVVDMNSESQKKGQGTLMMRNLYQLAQQLDAKQITMDAVMNGSYVWARFGFVPTQTAWEEAKPALHKKLKRLTSMPEEMRGFVESVLASPDPKAIWILADIPKYGVKLLDNLTLGNDRYGWKGVLDLHDTESVQRFETYVQHKMLKHAAAPEADIRER